MQLHFRKGNSVGEEVVQEGTLTGSTNNNIRVGHSSVEGGKHRFILKITDSNEVQ